MYRPYIRLHFLPDFLLHCTTHILSRCILSIFLEKQRESEYISNPLTFQPFLHIPLQKYMKASPSFITTRISFFSSTFIFIPLHDGQYLLHHTATTKLTQQKLYKHQYGSSSGKRMNGYTLYFPLLRIVVRYVLWKAMNFTCFLFTYTLQLNVCTLYVYALAFWCMDNLTCYLFSPFPSFSSIYVPIILVYNIRIANPMDIFSYLHYYASMLSPIFRLVICFLLSCNVVY